MAAVKRRKTTIEEELPEPVAEDPILALQRQGGPQAQLRREQGKVSIAEAARLLGTSRPHVSRMCERGEFRTDEHGWLDVEDVEAYLEQIQMQRNDPAVHHLTQAFDSQVKHSERMATVYMGAMERMLTVQTRTIELLGKEVTNLHAQNVRGREEYRQILSEKSESELEHRQAQASENQFDSFLGMAKQAIALHGGSDKRVLPLVTEIFEDMEPDQLTALGSVLRPSQLGKLQKVIELAESMKGANAAAE